MHKDGTRFWANEIATAIRDERGEMVGFTKVSRDLSEQKEMQEQREELLAEATAARGEAEKANRAKDDFLITLSHELRTPLAPILLWGRALRAGMVPANEISNAIEAIVMSAESQLQLIDDLRDLSRLKSGRVLLDKQTHSVEDVARAAIGVIGPSALAKGVTLDLDVAPDLGEAVLDRGRFQQVLWNLLSNAIKFTPEEGRVSLRIRKQAGQLEAVVADTGQGIEPDFLPHLFQRFRQAEMRERRRYGGIGVGLALCRHLVELHGGTVEGHSDGPGRGAMFIVRIPWISPEAELLGDDATAAEGGRRRDLAGGAHGAAGRGRREHARRDALDAGTGAAPRSSRRAPGRRRCRCSKRVTGRDAPDVMVCDLGLPGMNGYDLIERVVETPAGSRAEGDPRVRGERARARRRSRARHRRGVRLVRRQADERPAPHRSGRGAGLRRHDGRLDPLRLAPAPTLVALVALAPSSPWLPWSHASP